MSRRRKHVRELVDEPCPDLEECELVCRVVELRGGNHIEVQKPDASHTLCRIPSKFVKILWVRSGSFIVARFDGEDLEDDDANKDKITGEMTRALYDIQQKEMRKNGRWPELFNEVSSSGGGEDVSGLGGDGEKDDDENSEGGDYSSDSDLPPIEVIKNRTRRPRDDTESDESDEDEDA